MKRMSKENRDKLFDKAIRIQVDFMIIGFVCAVFSIVSWLFDIALSTLVVGTFLIMVGVSILVFLWIVWTYRKEVSETRRSNG